MVDQCNHSIPSTIYLCIFRFHRNEPYFLSESIHKNHVTPQPTVHAQMMKKMYYPHTLQHSGVWCLDGNISGEVTNVNRLGLPAPRVRITFQETFADRQLTTDRSPTDTSPNVQFTKRTVNRKDTVTNGQFAKRTVNRKDTWTNEQFAKETICR